LNQLIAGKQTLSNHTHWHLPCILYLSLLLTHYLIYSLHLQFLLII